MLNCQTLNNLCLCLSCSTFVLQSKLTDSFARKSIQQMLLVNQANAPGNFSGDFFTDRPTIFPSSFAESSELFSFPPSDEPQGHSFRAKFMSKFGTEVRAYRGGRGGGLLLTDNRKCVEKQRWQAIQFWLSVKCLKP